MRSRKKTLSELTAGIQKSAENKNYNPAQDIQILNDAYRRMSGREYLTLLDTMAEKYSAEWSTVHAALVAKARTGDVEAIRLYRDSQTAAGSGESGVTIIDDL
jgi:hypothetical protein